MQENQQSTCPSCGLMTLEIIRMAQSAGNRLGRSVQVLMFECRICLWRGSTATLNTV
jgi:hypothetical protein